MSVFICQNPRCLLPNKMFEKKGTHQYKYCSRSCAMCVNGSKSGRIGRIKANITNKKNHTGFYDPKIHSMGGKAVRMETHIKAGKASQKTLKRLGISAFYDIKIQHQNGLKSKQRKTGIFGISPEQRTQICKKGIETNRRNKTGCCFDPKWFGVGGKKSVELKREKNIPFFGVHEQHVQSGKKSAEVNRQNKTNACFDSKWFGVGGTEATKTLRKKYANKRCTFLDIVFDSKQEMEVCKKLMQKYPTWTPIQNETVHKTFGRKEADFLINTTFIYYHPFDIKNRGLENYYQTRRKVLDENGFKDYHYIVVANLKNIDNISLDGEGVI